MPSTPALLDHFRAIAPDYDVVLCDVWGVIHDSIVPFAEACDSLARFRAGGGVVVLVTNAPRTSDVVAEQLDEIGVARAAYDAIATSGDVTRALLAARAHQAVFHLGPERDLSLFRELHLPLATADTADYVVCSGLFDDNVETPDDYRPLLGRLLSRSLTMVCANPDLVVARGSNIVYCAGSIAALYETLGGEVIYAGKPHRPIYERALSLAAAARGGRPSGRVLAIGDSVRTDLAGAAAFGCDCLLVNTGIHAGPSGPGTDPADGPLPDLFEKYRVWPRVVMRRLAW
jgi:HAD superfamily hydrolase (TIGR01459 family)